MSHRPHPHRSHDYEFLVRRWRHLAARRGLEMWPFAESDGFPLYALRPRETRNQLPPLYISAGIHGDEPAATEALLAWTASRTRRQLAARDTLLLPCLNPWGLINNLRTSQTGLDLNRCFHRDDLPLVQGWRELMRGRRFAVALCLHEDFDGRGLYIYETMRATPFWGEDLVAAGTADGFPAESRRLVEGKRCRHGIIRRRIPKALLATMPEAFALHLAHAERTFTIETPSEFGLAERVAVQVRVINAAASRHEAV